MADQTFAARLTEDELKRAEGAVFGGSWNAPERMRQVFASHRAQAALIARLEEVNRTQAAQIRALRVAVKSAEGQPGS